MVYLAALALAGMLALHGALQHWDQQPRRHAHRAAAAGRPTASPTASRAAVALLRATPGMIQREPLSREAIQR